MSFLSLDADCVEIFFFFILGLLDLLPVSIILNFSKNFSVLMFYLLITEHLSAGTETNLTVGGSVWDGWIRALVKIV